MKDYKAIAEKSKELINELKFTQDIIFIHQLESELTALESQEVEGVSAEDEIKLLNETINNLHKAMVTAEKRGHDKVMEEYAQSSKIDEKFIRENIPFAIKPSKASSTAFISPFSSNYAREQVIKALVEAINKI